MSSLEVHARAYLGRPKFRIQDKPHSIWLTWEVAYTELHALEIVIHLCKKNPGRAVRIETIDWGT